MNNLNTNSDGKFIILNGLVENKKIFEKIVRKFDENESRYIEAQEIIGFFNKIIKIEKAATLSLNKAELNYFDYFHKKINDYVFKMENTAVVSFDSLLNLKYCIEEMVNILEIRLKQNYIQTDYEAIEESKKKVEENFEKVSDYLLEAKVLTESLRVKKIKDIYDNESSKLRRIAFFYEVAFYTLCLCLVLYFFGYYLDINTKFIKINFANHLSENVGLVFYIQKISLLIISTTLAAFFLKRSFMNQRLADEAHRTGKELDALPRYLESLPEGMREKVRFDLAYKYFGQGIHHDSYTGGENLMHENIKANTEFLKAIKGSGSDEKSKKDDEK